MYDYNNPKYFKSIWEQMKLGFIFAIILYLIALATGRAQTPKQVYKLSDTPIQIDSTTGGMIYTEVVHVDSASADQLYSRAKSFITKAFTNDGAVTQSDDKTNGVVTGRGRIAFSTPVGAMLLGAGAQMYYEMACEIRVKDGRYRYEFSNLEIINGGYRVRIDEQFRKNPKIAYNLRTRPISQRDYDRYMSDKNPVMTLIRQLKTTMNPPRSKNDF